MDRIRQFFREVVRRRVFATTALYVVAAWAAIQVADLSIEAGLLRVPLRSVFIAAFLGFPIALVVAWSYDITRKGIVRTPPAGSTGDVDRSLGRKDYIRLIALAAVWVLANLIVYTPPATDRSIAILPFENRGHDPKGADLAFGIRLDLQSQLETLHAIRVIATTSTDNVDSTLPVGLLGQQLGAAYILKGTVERVIDRVRVSVTLIDAKRDEQRWSSSWDREIDIGSLFDIRDDIAIAITSQLRAELSPQEVDRIRGRGTDNLAAHQAYLLGRQRMAKRVSTNLGEAVEYFEEAVELDPGYARAWVGLAESRYLYALYSGQDTREWLPMIEEASRRALELDRMLGEAYAIRAVIEEEFYDDDNAAVESFQRAMELSPGYSTTYHWYGSFLGRRDREAEATVYKQKALELDPASANTNLVYGYSLQKLGRVNEAIEYYHKAIEIDPDVPTSYERLAEVYHHYLGRTAEAVVWQREAITRDPEEFMGSIYLGVMYLDLGDTDTAERWFDRAASRMPPGFPFAEALNEPVLLRRGDIEAALEVARQTIEFDPGGRHSMANLRNDHLRNGRSAEARALYERFYPELLDEDAPELNSHNHRAAVDLALVLLETGETERARYLLEQSLEYVGTIERLGINGYAIDDVLAYTMLGQTDRAVRTLRQAVDEGWRGYWWIFLELDPALDPLRDDPEFLSIVEEIRMDMAAQRQKLDQMRADGELPPIP